MIFKQELSPQNGHYTPLLCFHLGRKVEISDCTTVGWKESICTRLLGILHQMSLFSYT